MCTACVHAGTDHFAETCATLRAASSALAIRAPCLRLGNVLLSDVRLLQPQSVLPPAMPLDLPQWEAAAAPKGGPLPAPSARRDASPARGIDEESVSSTANWTDDPLGWEAEYDDDVGHGSLSGHAQTRPKGSTKRVATRLRGAGQFDETPGAHAPQQGKRESDPARWVTRELERRVQEELAIARSARGDRGGAVASQPPTPQPPAPQVVLAEQAPVIRSYAAQHAKVQGDTHQRRQTSLGSHASPPRASCSASSSRCAASPCRAPSISGSPGKSQVATPKALAASCATASSCAAVSDVDAAAIEQRPQFGELQDGNYETVLSMLKEADDSRKEERARTDEAERDALEKETLHDIALADEKAKVLELQKKLRRMQSTTGHLSAFELYEADIESLSSQLDAARAENSELEAACREASIAYEVARDAARQASGEQWPGGISATMEAKLNRVKSYRRALTSTEKELKELRAGAAETAKTVRQGEVHRRRAEEATARLQKLAREHSKTAAELTNARLLASGAEARHTELVERVRTAQDAEEDANQAAAIAQQEVTSLKEQLASLEFERRKDAVVLRMAPRLQSSAEKLRKHLMGRTRARSTPRASGSAGLTAPDALLSIERELSVAPSSNPKVSILVKKAKHAVDALESARQEGVEREDELLQLLVENTQGPDGPTSPGSQKSAASAAAPATLQAVTVRR